MFPPPEEEGLHTHGRTFQRLGMTPGLAHSHVGLLPDRMTCAFTSTNRALLACRLNGSGRIRCEQPLAEPVAGPADPGRDGKHPTSTMHDVLVEQVELPEPTLDPGEL